MTDIQTGSYAHRFQGNAMDMAGTPYFLAGVGVMQIVNGTTGITLTGHQESVTMPIQGFGGSVVNVGYALAGTVTKRADIDMWDATITFTQVGASPPIIMKATFALTGADRPDAYWAISTGGSIVQGSGVIPNETVAGEIVRTGD
jgi:hypothetical protein